jgi:transcriptional regulator with XRE-family HTH domain
LSTDGHNRKHPRIIEQPKGAASQPPESEGSAAFAARLTRALGSRSARAVAKEAAVSHSSIHKWATAKGEPSRAGLVSLARALGVSVGWLAAGEEAPRASGVAVDKHQLAISLKLVLEMFEKLEVETDAGTTAEIAADYYSEWERSGRQPPPKRLLSLVPKRR